MMKALFVTLVSSLLAVTCPLWSAEYKTDLLEEMATAMKIDQQMKDLQEGIHWKRFSYKGKKLSVIIHDGRVDHIGIALFTPFQRKMLGQKDIINFVERYMLECILPLKRLKSVDTKMREDKVVFNKGSLSYITDIVSSDTTYSFSSENRFGKQMIIQWSKESKPVCEVVFPIDFELLNGTDMIENQRRIVEDLHRTKSVPLTSVPLNADGMKRSIATGHYLYHGENYYTEQLNTNKYYEKDGTGKLRLTCDPRFPLESVSNLMTTTAFCQDTDVNITLTKYGMKKENFKIKLGQLTSYMLKNGCKIFFGIMSFDGNKVTSEVIYKNESLGYHHVMKAEIDIGILEGKEGTINARLTTYLPTSRLMYLFDELKI